MKSIFASAKHPIRHARTEDALRLAVVATQVWLHTYATDGVNEQIAQYVHSQLTPESYLQKLATSSVQVLVAEREQHIVGFAVAESGIQCPGATESTVELQTLYVQEHHVGQGVGKALLRTAEVWAQDHFRSALWLTVNVKNFRAIEFCSRNNYAKVGTAYFELEGSRYVNHVMLGPQAKLDL